MKKNFFENWKKLGLVFAILFAYTCVVTCISIFLFTLAFGNCVLLEITLLLAGGVLCCLVGYLSRIQAQKMNQRIKSIGIGAAGLALCIVFMEILFLWSDAWLISTVCAVLYFMTGWFLQKFSFSKLSSTLMILICLGTHGAVYFLSYFVSRLLKHLLTCQFPFDAYVLLIFPMILILLLFRNQSNLDELMTYGRKHIAKTSSNNRMSILFTVGIVGVIMLLYLLWNPALQIFAYLGNVIKYGVSVFLQWFFKLISSDEAPPAAPNDPLKLPEGGESNSILQIFFLSFALFIFLLLFIKLFPGLFEKFRDWLHSLCSRLKLHFFGKRPIKKDYSTYYYDNISDIERAERKNLEHSFFSSRRWGKFARKYYRTKDPVEQIRLCYAYALDLLRTTDAPPLKSDTPLEILHKTLEKKTRVPQPDLSEITQIYSDIRYAELKPDKEKNDHMFSCLKHLSKQLNTK